MTTSTNAEWPGGPSAVSFRNVTKRFESRVVLDDISLEIPRGQTTTILGPSGTGKSTLIRLAVGLVAADAGEIIVLGQNVGTLRRAELLAVRRRFAMLFQDGALFGSLTVRENVAFPLVHLAAMKPNAINERVDELLSLVGLPDVGGRLPSALSGGQRKRIALARALALEPELVFLDEPTSGLDPQTSAAIDDLVVAMQERLNLTFVVITHDTISAGAIAHNVAVLKDGKVCIFGPTASVWASQIPEVRDFLDRRSPERR